MKKISQNNVDSSENVSNYVEALKLHLFNNKIKNKEICEIVKNLPPAAKIKSELSEKEAEIIFESVRYVWKEITGQDIIEESKIKKAPETLHGNYWMIKNGVLMEGLNHFTIIKKNLELFSSLLGIDAFVLHEKLSGNANGLIKTAIDHGGIRIYIDFNKKLYCQMNDKTYSKWGRNKIKNLDFRKKIIKVIDITSAYNGWESGITIIV